jgi:hypothetical protein
MEHGLNRLDKNSKIKWFLQEKDAWFQDILLGNNVRGVA